MPYFSQLSNLKLMSCHDDLQEVCNRAIKIYDFSVICGHRNEKEQNEAFNATPKKSKLQWPNSNHNSSPSNAVDIAPWPIDWDDISRFRELSWVIKGVAEGLGVKIVWGGDWENPPDSPHYELVIGE